jgi:hypothetical protein
MPQRIIDHPDCYGVFYAVIPEMGAFNGQGPSQLVGDPVGERTPQTRGRTAIDLNGEIPNIFHLPTQQYRVQMHIGLLLRCKTA